MKRLPILVLLVLFAVSAPVVCEDINIAPRCRIAVSELANPAWDGQNIADQDVGPTKGWLGKVDPANPPWAKFVFPYPARVEKIKVLPASYSELGWGRFSRPKKITVLLKGDKPVVRDFDLKDNEEVFQELPIGLDNVYEVSIIIKEVYPGKRIQDQAGFQEVQIMVPPETQVVSQGGKPMAETPSPVDETRKILEKVNEKVAATQSANSPNGTQIKGELTADEQDILDLLRQLMQKLEQKFRED